MSEDIPCPPSGQIISAWGVVLNDKPPKVLLQVIEYLMARNHFGSEWRRSTEADRLYFELRASLRQFERRADDPLIIHTPE